MSAETHCGWCGRPVTAYIVRDIETDHGPVRIVWCKDVATCSAARAANPPRSTVQSRAIRGR